MPGGLEDKAQSAGTTRRRAESTFRLGGVWLSNHFHIPHTTMHFHLSAWCPELQRCYTLTDFCNRGKWYHRNGRSLLRGPFTLPRVLVVQLKGIDRSCVRLLEDLRLRQLCGNHAAQHQEEENGQYDYDLKRQHPRDLVSHRVLSVSAHCP